MVYTGFLLKLLFQFFFKSKENDSIDEVGKIEAHRAGHAYLLDWVNQSS